MYFMMLSMNPSHEAKTPRPHFANQQEAAGPAAAGECEP